MIEDVILKLKKDRVQSSEELDVKILFDTIVKSLIDNKELIDGYLRYEAGIELNISKIAEIFVPSEQNMYGNMNKPFINDFGRVSSNMVPVGVVAVKVDKNIRLHNYLEIIKVCLETKNSLVIKPFIETKSLEIIVTIINDVIGQVAGLTEIKLTYEDVENAGADLVVFIGLKHKFKELSTKSEKLFVGVGQYELYVDEPLDKNLIDFAKNNNIEIFYPQDDVYGLINEVGGNYCTAIMSGNKEHIREFISSVKSSNLLVNMSPLLVDKINLYPEQLLKRKNIVIFE